MEKIGGIVGEGCVVAGKFISNQTLRDNSSERRLIVGQTGGVALTPVDRSSGIDGFLRLGVSQNLDDSSWNEQSEVIAGISCKGTSPDRHV